jgi:hypothetical protein
MNTEQIIAQLDSRIADFEQARNLLTYQDQPEKPGPRRIDAKGIRRRVVSPAGRVRMSAAQKARWARSKQAK